MHGDDEAWMGPLPAAAGCECRICRPDERPDPDERRVVDTVLRHGWQVVLVSDDAGCDDPEHDHDEDHGHGHDAELDAGPGFAYTLGLGHRAGHPELLMSGLDPGLMHGVLNGVAQRVLAGRRLRPGDVLEDVLGGAPVLVQEVGDEGLRETVTWSGWFHRRAPRALVLVYPSTSGVFAWQPGAPEVLEERQPSRWRRPVVLPPGLEVDPPWPFPVPPDHLAFSCVHVVDGGQAVLWVAREPDPHRGEDWSAHCGGAEHGTDDMRLTHLAHLVRSAPSLRQLHDLGPDVEAWRDDTDSPWVRAPLLR